MEHDPSVDALERLIAARREQRVPWTPAVIAGRLGADVMCQSAAIDLIAPVLAVGLNGLSRRSAGPVAGLLFVGPTGCGKTEAARAMRVLTHAADRAVIRLDMSEYADQTSVGRLIGSNRGYVGYGDTATLLTTQVAQAADAVVIFDEVEKAHPSILPLLLQILDRGTLTDGRGVVARFDRTIVVLTSNLGAGDVGTQAGTVVGDARLGTASRMRDAVRGALAPELIGRLDAVVSFAALDDDARRLIARRMIDQWSADVADRGWSVGVDDDVVDAVVARSDARYGARPLLHSIERDLALGLAGRERGGFVARVVDDTIVWFPVHPARQPLTTPHRRSIA